MSNRRVLGCPPREVAGHSLPNFWSRKTSSPLPLRLERTGGKAVSLQLNNHPRQWGTQITSRDRETRHGPGGNSWAPLERHMLGPISRPFHFGTFMHPRCKTPRGIGVLSQMATALAVEIGIQRAIPQDGNPWLEAQCLVGIDRDDRMPSPAFSISITVLTLPADLNHRVDRATTPL